MIGSNNHHEAGQNILMSSLAGLANVLSVVAAFLLTPKVHGWTVDWVVEYVTEEYGHSWSALTSFAWFVIVGLTIFFGSRATIGTALIFGGMAIITRLL